MGTRKTLAHLAPTPELAGRSDVNERVTVAIDRIRAGKSARSFILYGLRGSVMLNRIRLETEARGIATPIAPRFGKASCCEPTCP